MKNDGNLTIWKLAPLIQKKKISPLELTKFLLDRISDLQPVINAFITVAAETALVQARLAESEIMRGDYRGPLHGIPISLKDIFYTRGIRTTVGSQIRKSFYPKENAAVVNRLLQNGCILLGKNNMHEFAYGATNVNPHFGPVRNPWDTCRISGGSSGGSAAAVVSAQAIAAMGTDTGGSIRIPSAACGCVGLKPTYGLISMDGVWPLAPSLDHAGPICRSVTDAAILLDSLVMQNPGAPSIPAGGYLPQLRKGVKGLRIGVPRQYFFDHLQADVREAVLDTIPVFENLGAGIREIDLREMAETARLAADITAAEALPHHWKWLKRFPHRYGRDVRLRLMAGKKMTALAYLQARHKTLAYAEWFARIMDSVDLLLSPTLPVVAPRIDQKEIKIGAWREDVRLSLLSRTRPANLCGFPAISVPCGFSREGLPVGLHLMARRNDEVTLLRAACAYENATPWHLKFPSMIGDRNPV